MAFGGFFGGGNNNNDSSSNTSSSSSSSSDQTPSITSPLTTSFPSSSSSTLQRIQTAITEQSNVSNAKQLISNVHTNCFEKCVPNPGSSLSASEQKCLTNCMEKYIDAWNTASRSYTGRLQQEGAMRQAGGLGQGGGKEMF